MPEDKDEKEKDKNKSPDLPIVKLGRFIDSTEILNQKIEHAKQFKKEDKKKPK